ncbi:hypothetical protein KAR91_44025 [Candidatus Pacearchaeota archaeon]|nr:hypothetical protein [Candidatus Pacearchaeota archaeon]
MLINNLSILIMEDLPKQLPAPQEKKKGVRIRFGHYSEQLGYTMKEIFIGKRTIFSIAGFIVGGIMVGRSIWEYSVQYLDLPLTLLIGFLIFTFSGLALHEFHDKGGDDHDLLV